MLRVCACTNCILNWTPFIAYERNALWLDFCMHGYVLKTCKFKSNHLNHTFCSHYRRLRSIWSPMVSSLPLSFFFSFSGKSSKWSLLVNIFLRYRCWGSGIQASSWRPEQQPSKGDQGTRGENTLLAEISIKESSKLTQFITVDHCFWECLLEGTWTSCFCLGCIPRAADCKGFVVLWLHSTFFFLAYIKSMSKWWEILIFCSQESTSTCSIGYWVLNLLQVLLSQ